MITQYYTFFGLPDNHNVNIASMVFDATDNMRELVGFIVGSRTNSVDVLLWKPKEFKCFNVLNISEQVSDVKISGLLIDLLLLFPESVPQWNNVAGAVHSSNSKGGLVKFATSHTEQNATYIGDEYFVYTAEQNLLA